MKYVALTAHNRFTALPSASPGGTTHEVTLGDCGRASGIDWKPLVFDRVDTMYRTFFGGRCDAMAEDASALAGAVATASGNPADDLVLPQAISKEPLGPFTRNGD